MQENEIISQVKDVLDGVLDKMDIKMKITNEDRTFGALLSNHVSTYVFFLHFRKYTAVKFEYGTFKMGIFIPFLNMFS